MNKLLNKNKNIEVDEFQKKYLDKSRDIFSMLAIHCSSQMDGQLKRSMKAHTTVSFSTP